jgi:peptidoglycan hydrolase-like protein with peptidoglycan-binding domain
VRLAVEHAHAQGGFAVVGERVLVVGGVRPYVAGQRVQLSVYRDGRRVRTERVSVSPARGGTGTFRLWYASPRAGEVEVRAVHAASTQMGAFSAKPARVRFYGASLSAGARGPAVWALQRELARLRYAVPLSGYFDEATGRAAIAYRKMTGLPLVEDADASVFALLERGEGAYRVRFPRDGDHVEANLSKQVLVEVERRGRVRLIYTMSSGKPSTPTPLGSFRVYQKSPGTSSDGMVDSNYFISGYAIHGYAEVPTYAASHGCLRIPIPDAAAVFGWVQVGYRVDVYR